MRNHRLALLFACLICSSLLEARSQETRPEKDDQARIENALELAGQNANEIQDAIDRVAPQHKPGLEFLVANMPPRDLQELTADFLIEHVELAYLAREESNWSKSVPEEVFLNSILPYANVNEQRDNVRRQLRVQFWPIVSEFKSISKAAAKLNEEVFKQLEVRYSRKRRRADQGPKETMESGTASCTGLSILLIDACRACGIPARFVGTPLWSDGSGNHSWVEIWDDGWHFTGAAEPTGDQLDRGWFIDRASKAQIDVPEHSIYAVSFERTEIRFPMVWTRDRTTPVWAINVTERYARPAKTSVAGIEVMLRALQPSGNDRCRANVVIKDADGKVVYRGQTNDESHDANDHLVVQLESGKYAVEWATPHGTGKQDLDVSPAVSGKLVNLIPAAPSPLEALKDFLESESSVSELPEQSFASVSLTQDEASQTLDLLVEAHYTSLRKSRRAEHEQKEIVLGELRMPYEYKTFGDPPASGHSLVISMHGGGGAPARLNDSQWQNQKRLYELEEGIYLAPRAPTNTWNLWHQSHIDAFFTRLIENFILFEGINPNRVFITGYSAGGDGVFQLAPRMADQLAGAAMMAGHPNETKPDGLLNLPFTLHMGENDGAYNRNKKAEEWKGMLAALAEEHPGGYQHWVEIHEGKGHWMERQDREGVRWMQKFSRSMTPTKVIWLQDDVLHDRFYWLSVAPGAAQARSRIEVSRRGNQIIIEQSDIPEFSILLRDDMCDLGEDIEVVYQARSLFKGSVDRTIKNIWRTLSDRGDREAVFPARVNVSLTE